MGRSALFSLFLLAGCPVGLRQLPDLFSAHADVAAEAGASS